jgi:hypothetical protein
MVMQEITLAQKVEDFVKENKEVTKALIARSIGISPAQLTQFLKGEYKMSANTQGKLEMYVENYSKNYTKGPLEEPFIMMKQAKSIFFVADECRTAQAMGLVYGHPGTGKSKTLQKYAQKVPDSVLIEVEPEITVRNFLWGLADAVGAEHANSKVDTTRNIVKRLKTRDAMILIDEAEHLSVAALEHIRRIWDFTRVPILLVGTEVLLRNLMGTRGDMAQLYSRVGLKWVTKPIEGDEGSLLCEAWGIDPALGPVIVGMTGGNLRKSVMLIDRSIRLSQLSDATVDQDLLDEAARMLIL